MQVPHVAVHRSSTDLSAHLVPSPLCSPAPLVRLLALRVRDMGPLQGIPKAVMARRSEQGAMLSEPCCVPATAGEGLCLPAHLSISHPWVPGLEAEHSRNLRRDKTRPISSMDR